MASRLESAYKKIRGLSGDTLVRQICEVTLTPPRPKFIKPRTSQEIELATSNPFARVIEEEAYIPRACGSFRDLADIFISQLTNKSFALPEFQSELPNDYVSFRHYIKGAAKRPECRELPSWLFVEPEIEQILWFFFDANQHCFDDAIDEACRLVYHGMPLYRTLDNGEYELVPFDDDIYVYLSNKAHFGETCGGAHESPGRYARWSEEFAFCRQHFRNYRNLYGRPNRYYSELSVIPLSSALRSHLGFVTNLSDTTPVATSKRFRLVPILNSVLSRDCDGLFNKDVDTWPKQEAISTWLQKNKKLSKRQADAIALVATQSK